jgi:hypothetical protein
LTRDSDMHIMEPPDLFERYLVIWDNRAGSRRVAR